MKLASIIAGINPSVIDDPVQRAYWEAVRQLGFELERGLAGAVAVGNNPDIASNPSADYLFKPGINGGQTAFGGSARVDNLVLAANLNIFANDFGGTNGAVIIRGGGFAADPTFRIQDNLGVVGFSVEATGATVINDTTPYGAGGGNDVLLDVNIASPPGFTATSFVKFRSSSTNVLTMHPSGNVAMAYNGSAALVFIGGNKSSGDTSPLHSFTQLSRPELNPLIRFAAGSSPGSNGDLIQLTTNGGTVLSKFTKDAYLGVATATLGPVAKLQVGDFFGINGTGAGTGTQVQFLGQPTSLVEDYPNVFSFMGTGNALSTLINIEIDSAGSSIRAYDVLNIMAGAAGGFNTGHIVLKPGTVSGIHTTEPFTVVTVNAYTGNVPFAVYAPTGITKDLTQWQVNSVTLAKITKDGYVNAPRLELVGASATLTHKVATGGASYSLTWPSADGTAGYFLQTDGAGALSWAAGGGGGGAPHAILDGSTHTDSVAQVVSRGSLIYGNSTPKWDELTIGSTGKFLRSNGTDISWQLLVAGDIPDLSATYQPLDSDLTAVAALTTLAYGRSFLELLNAAAGRTLLGLGTLATQNGTFSGTSSGTNTGDQTITLTGDVTGSGTGSFAATVANDAITLAKMANVATGTVFYRTTAGTGDPEVTVLATLKTDLGLTGTNSGDQTITLTGDVTGSGTGSFATAIGANKVTNAMIRQGAALSVIGVTGAATANVDDIVGVANQVLRVNSGGTALGFGAVNLASGSAVTGTLPVSKGGVGADLSPLVVGDIFYATASATWGKLAAVATGNVLLSGGTGTAPSWGKVGLTTHISGTLAIGSGGTGQTTAVAGFDALSTVTSTSFGRSFLPLADAAAGRTLLGLGTLATQSGTFSGTSSGTNTGDQTITLTSEVTGSGTGSFATIITKSITPDWTGNHQWIDSGLILQGNAGSPVAIRFYNNFGGVSGGSVYLSASPGSTTNATIELPNLPGTAAVTGKGGAPPNATDVLGKVNLSNQVTNISSTNLTSGAPAGEYLVSGHLACTTAEAAAANVTLTLGWTTDGGATTAPTQRVMTSVGPIAINQPIYLSSGNITFTTSGYTNPAGGVTPAYAVRLRLTYLGP